MLSELANERRRRRTAALVGVALAALLLLDPALAQTGPADGHERLSASGLTPLSDYHVGWDGTAFVYVTPTDDLHLAEPFLLSEESRIFVSLVDAADSPQLAAPGLQVLRAVLLDSLTFTVELSAEPTGGGYVSWLVLNSDEIVGPPGQACWDLNGNGLPDPEEDLNEDGVVDVLDCQGPPGEQGPPGPQGEQGPPGEQGEPGEQGPAGLACWDLNENGVADPEEDVNEDGVVDVLDCQGVPGEQGEQGPQGEQGEPGEQGPAGLACWDLNENGVADLEEDVNGDGVVDVLDCQGETGPVGPAGPPGPAGPALELFECPSGSAVVGFDDDGQPECSVLGNTGFVDDLPCEECEDVYELEFDTLGEVELLLNVPPGREGDVRHVVFDPLLRDILADGEGGATIAFVAEPGQRYVYAVFTSDECGAAAGSISTYTVLLTSLPASVAVRTADDKRPVTFATPLC